MGHRSVILRQYFGDLNGRVRINQKDPCWQISNPIGHKDKTEVGGHKHREKTLQDSGKRQSRIGLHKTIGGNENIALFRMTS